MNRRVDMDKNRSIFRHLETMRNQQHQQQSVVEPQQYEDLIRRVVRHGEYQCTSDVHSSMLAVFGHQMRFSLKNGTLPLITTAKVNWARSMQHLHTMIAAQQNLDVAAHATAIAGGSARDHIPIPQCCVAYAAATSSDARFMSLSSIIMQLDRCVAAAGKDAPEQFAIGAKPLIMRLHYMHKYYIILHFSVSGAGKSKKLSCCVYLDTVSIDNEGLPERVASMSFLVHMLAHRCKMSAHELIVNIGTAYAADDKIESLMFQTMQTAYRFPMITFPFESGSRSEFLVDEIVWVLPYLFHK